MSMSFTPRNAALIFAPIRLKEAFYESLVRRGFTVSDPDRLCLVRPKRLEGRAAEPIAVSALDEFAPVGSCAQGTDDLVIRSFIDEFAVSLRWDLFRERLFGAGAPAEALSDTPCSLFDRDDWEVLRIDLTTNRVIGAGRVFRRLRIYESRAGALAWGAVIAAARPPLLNCQGDDLIIPAPREPRIPADGPLAAAAGAASSEAVIIAPGHPAPPHRPKPTNRNVRKWMRDRVQTWPDHKPAPSEEADFAAARTHFADGLSRDELRLVREETPDAWRRQGKRQAWGVARKPAG
jgi:hypothetical protein